jgi:hypothetical protein
MARTNSENLKVYQMAEVFRIIGALCAWPEGPCMKRGTGYGERFGESC